MVAYLAYVFFFSSLLVFYERVLLKKTCDMLAWTADWVLLWSINQAGFCPPRNVYRPGLFMMIDGEYKEWCSPRSLSFSWID